MVAVRRIPLHRQLFILVIAGILPLAVLAGAGLAMLYQDQRDVAQQRALEVTRAFAIAVDAELQRSVAALQVLAATATLRRGDLALFDEVARRALQTQPGWRTIIVSDAEGRTLVNTSAKPGEPLPPPVQPESTRFAAETRAPLIGTLARGRQTYAFPIRVPVVADGGTQYVVTAVVDPTSILAIVQRQRVPKDWVISVFDAAGLRVARSKAHESSLGTPAAESLGKLMAQPGNEGVGITRLLEGDEVFSAFARLPATGWAVAIGFPVEEVNADARRSVMIYGVAVVLSIAVGLLVALAVARRINRPIAKLGEGAQLLGRGGIPEVPETAIREIHDVGEAIANAARQRRQFESEREELLRREQAARNVAEEANRAKDQFLAMLGHELRNPLAALSNASTLLGHSQANPAVGLKARDVIQRQVAHLARLTDDLLDAAGAVLGKIELRTEPVNLAAVVAEALETMAATGRTGKHQVETYLGEAWMRGDTVRLHQIVNNLVVNAVKYTPPGGRLRVRTERDKNQAVLIVADDGAGMSPELASRVFDLFVQGERSLDRAQGGLGVGLTLVRRLAQLHGGTAEVRSDGEGLGSTFTVRFPAIDPPERPGAGEATRSEALSRNILVVEDNDDARETLQSLLEIMGHRVEAAADGATGLEMALASAPDVAIIDLGLPGMDGLEVARRIRAAEGASIYLVALTGYGAPADRERALAAGFDAHLTKPVEAARLGEALARRKVS